MLNTKWIIIGEHTLYRPVFFSAVFHNSFFHCSLFAFAFAWWLNLFIKRNESSRELSTKYKHSVNYVIYISNDSWRISFSFNLFSSYQFWRINQLECGRCEIIFIEVLTSNVPNFSRVLYSNYTYKWL